MSRSRVTTFALTHGKTITVAALGPVLAFSLVACGGGASTASSGAAATPSANATGVPGAPGRGAFNGADFAKIQACLKASGISLPTRTGFPRPSGSFVRPSGGYPRPSGVRPSGGRGFGGRGGGVFSDPKVKAALQACGITVPTFSGRPTAAPTS